MNDGILTDLDELVMQVRDRTSRAYLQEAVAAYRGKAFRSAVVATWLAVVFDIISKIRELANQGDGQAIQEIEKIDRAIAANNIPAMQNIEAALLGLAKSPFEFLTDREVKDLERLRDDRHHSAHPAFVQPGAMFVPSPDLVRSHIVHAASHLLRHPAVQGKSALSRIKSDLLQPSFPSDRERAIQYFTTKYLNHVRHTLIESLIVVFLKSLVARAEAALLGKEQAIGHCLAAIAIEHPLVYDRVFREQIKHLTDGVGDDTLMRVFSVLPTDPQCWTRLDEPVRLRMTEILSQFSRGEGSDIEGFDNSADVFVLLLAICVPELKKDVQRLFRRLSRSVQVEFIGKYPRIEVVPLAVEVFASARSFRGAESLAQSILIPLAPVVNAEHIRAFLSATQENAQIWDAGGMPDIVLEFFEATSRHHRATADAWRAFRDHVVENGRRDAYEALRLRMIATGLLKAEDDQEHELPPEEQ